MNKKKNKDVKPSQEMPKTEIQKFMDIRDTEKSIQDLAASAAEIIASEGLPTSWDDILPMLDNMEISEQSRLAAHIIFRAKQVLEEIEKSPSLNNVIFNTMVMMDVLGYANIKGYFPSSPTINFNKLETQTSSLAKAIKKDATASKFNIQFSINYDLYSLYKNCKLYSKEINTVSNYNVKSAGYSFGTDLSQRESVSQNINKNINKFISSLETLSNIDSCDG